MRLLVLLVVFLAGSTASAEPTAEQKLDACLSSHFALTFIRVNDGFKKSAAELIAADERSLSEKFKEALTEDLEMNLLQVFRVLKPVMRATTPTEVDELLDEAQANINMASITWLSDIEDIKLDANDSSSERVGRRFAVKLVMHYRARLIAVLQITRKGMKKCF